MVTNFFFYFFILFSFAVVQDKAPPSPLGRPGLPLVVGVHGSLARSGPPLSLLRLIVELNSSHASSVRRGGSLSSSPFLFFFAFCHYPFPRHTPLPAPWTHSSPSGADCVPEQEGGWGPIPGGTNRRTGTL